MTSTLLTSIHGRRLGISPEGNLAGNELEITREAVDCTITVGDEAANVRDIAIQLKDLNGDDIKSRQAVELLVLLDANGDAFAATGGSTGIELDTDGALLPIVAKKYFKAISEADGDIDLTWTDTGTEAAYLGVLLPNGRLVISDALTNA